MGTVATRLRVIPRNRRSEVRILSGALQKTRKKRVYSCFGRRHRKIVSPQVGAMLDRTGLTRRVLGRARDDRRMSSQEDRWSSARNPYAIAVSQSWWAMVAVLQFAADARVARSPPQQIYVRQIFGHLRLLQRCALMQAQELARLGIDQVHRDQLQDEIDLFERAVPGAKSARDMLEHFDQYARGDGQLQRKAMKELGVDMFEAAAMFWGGGYDPATEELTEGPFVVAISQAIEASRRLHTAIYRAAQAVDAARRPA
jgi:hypothetical protein